MSNVSDKQLIHDDIDAYLERYQSKELLRFVAVGSVDDGKSTLIGRMLYDTGMVYEDHLAQIKKASTQEGMEIDLPTEQLTIGRSSESGLVIRDDYTSTHHARLMLWNDEWVIQDLDSTNGTFLDGTRVTLPTPVPVGSTVTIGTTSFELRR